MKLSITFLISIISASAFCAASSTQTSKTTTLSSTTEINNTLSDPSKLSFDTSSGQIYSGSTPVKLDETKFDLVASENYIGTIKKNPTWQVDAIQPQALVDFQHVKDIKHLILPSIPGTGIYSTPDSYTVADYVNYLLSLSNTDLLNAAKSNLIGQCRMIRRTYLPVEFKPKLACEHAFYLPKLQENLIGSFSKKVRCIPGATLASGRNFGCPTGSRGGVCMQSTMDNRTAAFIRAHLKKTLLTTGYDPCDITSVVAKLNQSKVGVIAMDDLINNPKIKFKKNSNGETYCYYKLDAESAALFPSNLVTNSNGQKSIPLSSSVCQFAEYRALRTAATGQAIPSLPEIEPATEEDIAVVSTLTNWVKPNIETNFMQNHHAFATLLANENMSETALTASFAEIPLNSVKFDGDVDVFKSDTDNTPLVEYKGTTGSAAK